MGPWTSLCLGYCWRKKAALRLMVKTLGLWPVKLRWRRRCCKVRLGEGWISNEDRRREEGEGLLRENRLRERGKSVEVGAFRWLREERLRGENGGLCGEESLAGLGDGFPG